VVGEDQTLAWETQAYFGGREASFSPYRWSLDGRTLYFTVNLDAQGYVPFNDGVGLQRLDLRTGEVEEILPAGDFSRSGCCPNWSAFSLSPDGRRLAYITTNGRKLLLVLRNTATGGESRLWLAGYSSAGSMAWSPNGDWLAFAMASGNQWEDTLFTLTRVRVNDLTQRVLLRDDPRFLDPVEWAGPNEIVVKERLGGYYLLNVLTQEIASAPPPTPAP
jgi:Tol biopolymer transport system component